MPISLSSRNFTPIKHRLTSRSMGVAHFRIHAKAPGAPATGSRGVMLQTCIPLRTRTSLNKTTLLAPARGRHLRSYVCASLSGDSSPGFSPASFPLPYAAYSAELLLAVARLGHLERYRLEVAQFHEPGGTSDLTRCGLLITNIFSPQLDHRPYYQTLEDLIGRATLAALATFDNAEALWDSVLGTPASSSSNSSSNTGSGLPMSTALSAAVAGQPAGADGDGMSGFSGLDPAQPDHLLRAIAAINQVLFREEGLSDNAGDPYDPLNGSIADVMDSHKGNQYSLAMIYLHVAEGLGLPCAVVGSAQHILVRVGHPTTEQGSMSSTAGTPAAFLVDVASGGLVYAWPASFNSNKRGIMTHRKRNSSSNNGGSVCLAASNTMDTASTEDLNDEWHKALHALLQQQEMQAGGADGSMREEASSTTGINSSYGSGRYADDASSMLSDAVAGAEGDDSGNSNLQGWQEVSGYATLDADSRNSWKALYGSGALTEWGGTVSSSSSSSFEQHIQPGMWGDCSEADSNELGFAAAAAGQSWFGILESPFAAAAHIPFQDDEVVTEAPGATADSTAAASSSAGEAPMDSMDTCCGSDREEAEGLGSESPSSADSCSGGDMLPVLSLSEDAVWVKYGGLAPVRSRVMLQQLLAGMKLSLLLSGREEEALAVIRYLRATDPFSLPDLRDEALTLANMKQYEGSAQLLREYLAVAPGAPDADMVMEVLQQVLLAAELARAKARRQQG